MAGSQLKLLKAALAKEGLIGAQKKKKLSDKRRSDTEKVIRGIRDEYNRFDQNVNRTKRDVLVIAGGQFVKEGSDQHNDVLRRKGAIQRTLKSQYELERKQKGKQGGLIDRRFGEKHKGLLEEERMLERYRRERAKEAKKRVFSLELDDEGADDDEGFILTHAGKPLAVDDDDDNIPLKHPNEEDMVEAAPTKRKLKREVMNEIIAKSKFYKKQRQDAHAQQQEEIMDLDDEFEDVMDAVRESQPAKPQFSLKLEEDIAYDQRVRELTYDRRAAPADATETEEEIKKKEEERWKKLVAAREARMTARDAEGDDLDDYWHQLLDDEEGEEIDGEKGEDGDDEDGEGSGRFSRKPLAVAMPSLLKDFPEENVGEFIGQVAKAYAPHLAEGNKQLMDNFVALLFEYTVAHPQHAEVTIPQLRKLALKYNEELVTRVRNEINTIRDHLLLGDVSGADIFYFVAIGLIFSTSDHYHLVVTPAVIMINEYLASLTKELSLAQVYIGVALVDIYLQYQRLSKRYSPEVVRFMALALSRLVPEPLKVDGSELTELNLGAKPPKKPVTAPLSLSALPKGDVDLRYPVLLKLIKQVGQITDLWRDLGVLLDIGDALGPWVNHTAKYYAGANPEVASTATMVGKLTEAARRDRKPLTLQYHRAIAIPTYAPAFDENFNPNKHYDNNVHRAELNKLRHTLKKERKQTLKDIRQEQKFIAGEKIKETKQFYDDYHKKMSNIINSIQTTEGREKNEYDRERKRRKQG